MSSSPSMARAVFFVGGIILLGFGTRVFVRRNELSRCQQISDIAKMALGIAAMAFSVFGPSEFFELQDPKKILMR